MELSSLTEREEDVPLVSPSSCVPLGMGNGGGGIDPLANGCSSQSVQLWYACSLHRAKQAHFLNRCPQLSRRLARYHRMIALLQSPLAERSVTVSVSLRSPAVNLIASRRQVTFSAIKALRISRTIWLPRSDHLCPFALYGAFLHALVRHDPHDYYGHSVSVEVALLRKSRVPSR